MYHKLAKILIIGLCISLLIFLTNPGTDVTVNGDVKYQSIAGFEVTILGVSPEQGHSDADFGAAFSSLVQQLIEDFGFRFIKLRQNFHMFEPVNDNPDPFAFNWSAYRATFAQAELVAWFQRVKAARDAGAEIHLSAFIPPRWLAAPNGRRYKLDPHYARPDLYQEIAELWTAILVHLRKEYGVDVESVVVWNEPLYAKGPFTFSRSEFVETVKALGQRLQAENLKTEIHVSDDGSISSVRTSVAAVLADSAAAPYAAAVAYHTYDGGERREPDDLVNALKDLANDAVIAASGLELRMTEWAPLKPDMLSGQALVWAKHIYNCHVFGRTSVVDLWYIGPLAWSDADDSIENAIEKDGAGGMRWRKHIYAFKQFAKFIEPGSNMIEASRTVLSGTSTPAVSAYLHPTSERLTLVAINRSNTSKTINVALQNLAGYSAMNVYRTSASEDCGYLGNIQVSTGLFSYDLPALSITTFTSTPSAAKIENCPTSPIGK